MASNANMKSAASAIPTDEELLERAREIRPRLVERQGETEARSFYPESTHEEFTNAGFYKMLVPKRYGGYECDVLTYFRIVREVARGCPSTGWMLSQSINHTLTVASFFAERAQAEIFASGEFRAPLTAKPEGTAEKVEGGWKINGFFHYNSGAPYSTHMMSHVFLIDPETGKKGAPMMFIAPRDTYEIMDDWGDVLGLRGSGSHSIKVVDAIIPSDYATPGQTFLTMDPKSAIGMELHGNPLYGGSTLSFYMLGGSNVATGTAKGAVDCYEELMGSKTIPSPPFTPRSSDADYQRWFGRSVGQIATAECALDAVAREWIDLSARKAWKREEDVRFVGIGHEVVNNLAWKAIQEVVRTCGSTRIRRGERMERLWRDYSQLFSHGWQFLYDLSARDLSRERVPPLAAEPGNDWSPTFVEGAKTPVIGV
ncbi:MAG: acyl-CoA dehydrogenase family protein [Sphingobium phenoxybenzoativorans]